MRTIQTDTDFYDSDGEFILHVWTTPRVGGANVSLALDTQGKSESPLFVHHLDEARLGLLHLWLTNASHKSKI